MDNENELLKGPLKKVIMKMAMPTMLSFSFQAFYDIVDMIFIGQISPSAVASITLFLTYFWFVEVFNEIIGSSSVSMISQYFGSGNKNKTTLVCEQTLILKFLLAIIGSVLMFFTLKPVFNWFSNDPQVVSFGLDYGYIRVLFIPIFFSSYSVNTIFRCTGDTKTPMKILIISALINVVLDPVLMFDKIPLIGLKGFGLGMKGAAWATVISISFSFVVGLTLLLAGKAPIKIKWQKLFSINWEIDRKLLLVGLPFGLNLCLRNIFNFVFMKILANYGTAALAIVGVSLRIYGFAMMPQVGFQSGSGIIIGHCLGSGDEERSVDCVKIGRLFCLGFCAFFSLIMFIFSRQILSIFIPGQEILASDILLIKLFSLSILVTAWGTGYSAAFTGSGFLKPIMYSLLISQFVFMLPFCVIVYFFKLPVSVLWFVFLLGDSTEVFFRYYYYKQMRWIKSRV
ncbi:MAG: MATE family efflux transporter [Sphaerochaetaceae bacterium]|nr:MATE family efflux transporter [Sphaerochaetaceae bacterium]